MGKEQRLQVKIDELQEKWQLLTFKLRKLEEERILETDPEPISNLRDRIDTVKAEREEIEQELSDLEQQLKDIDRKTSKIDKSFIKTKRKILVLAANPKMTPRLRLDEEVREITEGLRRSKHRDQFEIHSVWAIRMRDLRRALLDHEPDIVHFTGHGNKEGLLVEDEMGMAVRVSAKALSNLFELFSEKVECVILSACYSAPQANAISKHIDYVIGMRKEIGDKAAIEFAVGFYDALGAGKSVENAFEFGCNAIHQYSIPEHSIPILRKSHREIKNFQQVEPPQSVTVGDGSKPESVFWKKPKSLSQVNKVDIVSLKQSEKISDQQSVESLSATRETLQRDFSLLELKSLSLDIGLDISLMQSKSVDFFVSELIAKAQKFNKLENLISDVERIRVSRETESIRKFLDNAGFDIRRIPDSDDFIAIPRISQWKKRFRKGIFVSVRKNKPLDQEAVFTICKKAQKYTDHALVVTNQQPELDGWMTIAGKRLNNKNPFILIPTTDTFIEEGLVLKNVRRKFANYIEKYVGKGYNPYDVRDPVFDVINFFGREGIMDEIEGDLKLGKKLGLFGIHKMGKSSVLKTLQKRLKFPIAYVYLKKDMSLKEIFQNILKAWEIDIPFKYPNFVWNIDESNYNSTISFETKVKELLERLGDSTYIAHLSVFLDEIETIIPYKDGDEDTLNRYVSLMDSLRGLQQETERLSLVVSGVHPTLARVNYFWGSQKNPMHQVIVEKFLPPLERDDCEVMISSLGKQVGLDYDDETMDYILRKSGAHPYLARQLCSAAYQKHKETGLMPFKTMQEAAEEFVYNPSFNDYFNDNALWGELAKENIWGKEIREVNHHILRKLADSEKGLSKAELSQGIKRTVFEESFSALKERSIIAILTATDSYHITFELFGDWIRAHKLNEKEE
jgi:hypothetical protein